MTDLAPGKLEAMAEFYLCLARAFLTPLDTGHVDALRGMLAQDLASLCGELDLPAAAHVASFDRAALELRDRDAWLQVYSAIFLAPPVAARINACYYMDGAVSGGSVRMLEDTYLLCGVAPAAQSHELADHVAMQLEFAAALLRQQARADAGEVAPPAVDARDFLYHFPSGWVGGLCTDLARAQGGRELPANPYLPLALILRAGVAAHARAPEVDPRELRNRQAMQRARAKYVAQGVDADALAEIRRKLEERGLSTEHLPPAGETRDVMEAR